MLPGTNTFDDLKNHFTKFYHPQYTMTLGSAAVNFAESGLNQ
jgi:hypothetical protein